MILSRQRRRPLLAALALTSAAAMTSACTGSTSDPATPGEVGAAEVQLGGQLRVATPALAASLDPAAEQSASYLRAHGAAEALMRIQADGSVVPELASEVEQTSETTWTITLREDATFWSGAPVDADAVVASLERMREVNTLGAGQLAGAELEVTDPTTVTVTTDGPAPNLPFALGHYQLVIHNTEAYGDQPGGTDPATADLTGPYRVTGFETDREMRLERHDGWWGGPGGVSEVVVQEVADPQARAQIALSGQAEVVQDVPSDRAQEIEAAHGVQLVGAPAANTVAVYLNPESPTSAALAEVRVRQALAWGVDRQEVVELATNGLSVPAPSWLASSPAVPGAADQGYTTYEPERAAELLDEAGWLLDDDGLRRQDGEDLTFRLMTFGAENPTGEVLQAQWSRLGVQVQVQAVENTLITQARESGDWDAFTQAWTTLGDTPTLIASQIGPGGAANHAELEPTEVPGLLELARTAPEDGERTQALLDLNQVMIDTVPLVPVHPRVQATAVADGVQGFVPHPLQYENVVQPDMTVG